MGFWERIKRVISSNLNAFASRAEEPDKILEQLVVEMRGQFAEAKRRVATAIADEKRLARQVMAEQAATTEWDRKARLAIHKGDDELAKKALLRKRHHGGRTEEFTRQHGEQKKATESLKEALHKLNARIEDARRKKDVLIARHQRAQAQKEIHETLAGIGDASTFQTFDRMAAQVDQLEAHGEAVQELAEEFRPDDLEAEFARLEAEADGAELLDELKEQMALEDSGPPAEAEAEALDVDLQRLKDIMAEEDGDSSPAS
jgi:phage shock protein A